MDQREPTAANGIEAEFNPLSDDADSTVIEQSSVESAPNEAEGSLFDRYEVADVSNIALGPELRNESRTKLCELVTKVVRAEGPVHRDVVIERIRLRYGIGRVRGSTRKRVYEAIAASVGNDLRWLQEGHYGRCASDVFLATPEQESQVRPRAPHDDARSDDPSRRKIEHIPLIELKTGILARAEPLYGASHDDLIVDAARRFGFKRTGKDVKARIGEAVDQLVAAGRLVGDSDMLRVAD